MSPWGSLKIFEFRHLSDGKSLKMSGGLHQNGRLRTRSVEASAERRRARPRRVTFRAPLILGKGISSCHVRPVFGAFKGHKKNLEIPKGPSPAWYLPGPEVAPAGSRNGMHPEILPVVEKWRKLRKLQKISRFNKKNMGICWEIMLIKHGLCKRKSKFFLRQSKVSQLGC